MADQKLMEVELPSGMKVTLKKMSVRAYRKIFSKASHAEDDPMEGLNAVNEMIVTCVQSPQMVDLEEGSTLPEGKFDLNELEVEDYMFLSSKVQALSGLEAALKTIRPTSQTGTTS